jgi:glyceraldehyde-3-phosphate dehydrogenase [NAD(P)+]
MNTLREILDKEIFEQICEYEEGVPVFKNYINGKWEPTEGGTIEVYSPLDDKLLAHIQNSTESDAERAVNAAFENKGRDKGFRAWPGIERVEVFKKVTVLLKEYRKVLVKTLVLDAGKPYDNAEGEISATIRRLNMVLEEARKIFGEYVPGDWSEDTKGKVSIVLKEPIGVVLAISPFNYPVYTSIAKLVPALLAGNTVVVKPPSADPLAFLMVARLFDKAGIPLGCLNVLTAHGKVMDYLTSRECVDLITFTGSTKVGQHIAKNAGMKRLHLELGGKGCAIVLEDADLGLAVSKIISGTFKYSGQRCDSISRILVVEGIADSFLENFIAKFDKLKFGDVREGNDLGPLISEDAASRVALLVKDAVGKGAKILRGTDTYHNCYFAPTVLDHVPLEADIAWEETFGPVATIIRVKDFNEAVVVANRSRYGLDSCIFTNDMYNGWIAAKLLETGEVTLNDAPAHGVGFFPFGGNKASGMGREGVGYSIDEMTRLKTVVFNLEPAGLGKVSKYYQI